MKRRSNRLKGGGPEGVSAPSTSGDKLAPFHVNPGDTGKKLLENPHTTMALMICIIVFVSMWAIFSLSPDEDTTAETKSFMLYEISMSVMSMTAAASGVAFFLLSDEYDSNSTVIGFPIIAGLSFLSWAYFAYGAYEANQA